MKIYGKKRFFSGIFYLILFAGYIVSQIISYNRGNEDFLSITKASILSLILLCFSIGSILTSLSEKANKLADFEEHDERNNLVELKANSLVNKAMFYLYFAVSIIFILLWYKLRIDTLLVPVIIFGLLISINFILNIIAIFYYDRKL